MNLEHALGPGAHRDPRRWTALVVLLAGAFLPPLDFFIVNVALPSIRGDLHASAAVMQLILESLWRSVSLASQTDAGQPNHELALSASQVARLVNVRIRRCPNFPSPAPAISLIVNAP